MQILDRWETVKWAAEELHNLKYFTQSYQGETMDFMKTVKLKKKRDSPGSDEFVDDPEIPRCPYQEHEDVDDGHDPFQEIHIQSRRRGGTRRRLIHLKRDFYVSRGALKQKLKETILSDQQKRESTVYSSNQEEPLFSQKIQKQSVFIQCTQRRAGKLGGTWISILFRTNEKKN